MNQQRNFWETLGQWLARPAEPAPPLAQLSPPGTLWTEIGMKNHLKPILTFSKSFWSAAEMLTVPGEAMPAPALNFCQLSSHQAAGGCSAKSCQYEAKISFGWVRRVHMVVEFIELVFDTWILVIYLCGSEINMMQLRFKKRFLTMYIIFVSDIYLLWAINFHMVQQPWV